MQLSTRFALRSARRKGTFVSRTVAGRDGASGLAEDLARGLWTSDSSTVGAREVESASGACWGHGTFLFVSQAYGRKAGNPYCTSRSFLVSDGHHEQEPLCCAVGKTRSQARPANEDAVQLLYVLSTRDAWPRATTPRPPACSRPDTAASSFPRCGPSLRTPFRRRRSWVRMDCARRSACKRWLFVRPR
jgi:hypothetical protein